MKRMMIATTLLATAVATLAETSEWQSTSDTDWGASGNWSSGVPSDIATMPTKTTQVNPDLKGGSYTVNQIVFGDKDFDVDGNGVGTVGGSLQINAASGEPGEAGVGLRVTDAAYDTSGPNIYANLVLGMASATNTQQWAIERNYLNLYGDVGGTGTIVLTNTYAYNDLALWQFFTPIPGPAYSGGLHVTPVNLVRCYPSDAYTAHGAYALGTGEILLETQAGSYVGYRDTSLLQWYFTSDASSPITVSFQNDIRVRGGYPCFLEVGLSKLTSGGTITLNHTGMMTLGALAVLGRQRDSVTGWHGGAGLAASGLVIDQSVPARCGLRPTRFSDDFRVLGAISDGAGSFANPLILGVDQTDGKLALDAPGFHAGGTVIDRCGNPDALGRLTGAVSTDAVGALGTGPVRILPSGRLDLQAAGIFSESQVVTLEGNEMALGFLSLKDDGVEDLPQIAASSVGVIGLSGTGSSAFNEWVASGVVADCFLGASKDDAGTFTGTTLPVGADGAYLLGGGDNGDYLVLNTLDSDAGVLNGPYDVQVGSFAINGNGNVELDDTNTFSGVLRVRSSALCSGNTTLAVRGHALGSGLGSETGAVEIAGASLKLLDGSVTKGALTVDGCCTLQTENWASASADGSRLTFDSLVRTNHAILDLKDSNVKLGDVNWIRIENPPGQLVSENGMVAPWCLVRDNLNKVSFADYDSVQGFAPAAFTSTDLATAGATDIVNTSAGAVNLAANAACYALRTGALGNSGSGDVTVTIGSGGLIVAGGDIGLASGNNVHLDFGGNEAVVRCDDGVWTTRYLYGALSNTGGNGLTKLGSSSVFLSNTNNSFTGPVTVNSGTLVVYGDPNSGEGHGSLGPLSNSLILNGGVLKLQRLDGSHAMIARNITLGPLGGVLRRDDTRENESSIQSAITGTGCLGLSGLTLDSAEVHHTGGTHLFGSALGDVVVSESAKLGTGPVMVSAYAYGSRQGAYFMGNQNLHYTAGPDVYLPLQCAGATPVFFQASTPVMGALSGTGDIVLGGTGSTSLTVGLDDADSTFYGRITQKAGKTGSLVKDGPGTFTLYGAHGYTGSTTVQDGELVLHAALAGSVDVAADGVLSGGGTIAGDLTVDGEWVLNVDDANAHDSLTVGGTLSCSGTLSVCGEKNLASGEVVVVAIAGSITGSPKYSDKDVRIWTEGNALLAAAAHPSASVICIR